MGVGRQGMDHAPTREDGTYWTDYIIGTDNCLLQNASI